MEKQQLGNQPVPRQKLRAASQRQCPMIWKGKDSKGMLRGEGLSSRRKKSAISTHLLGVLCDLLCWPHPSVLCDLGQKHISLLNQNCPC